MILIKVSLGSSLDNKSSEQCIDYLFNSLMMWLLMFGRFHGSVIIPVGGKEFGQNLNVFCLPFI